MKHFAAAILLSCAITVAASAAPMIDVGGATYEEQSIIPVAVGGDWYGDWGNNEAFNGQPTWDNINDKPVGGDNDYTGFGGYAGRWIYMDFGEDWENIYITQTWTKYVPWKNYSGATPYQTVRWDTDLDHWNGGFADEATVNFHVNTPASTGGGTEWYLDVNTRTAPVQAQARYLWIVSPDPDNGNMNEWVIRGVIVPEPATLALLSIGGIAALMRRKR